MLCVAEVDSGGRQDLQNLEGLVTCVRTLLLTPAFKAPLPPYGLQDLVLPPHILPAHTHLSVPDSGGSQTWGYIRIPWGLNVRLLWSPHRVFCWGLRGCKSNRIPGDGDAAGTGATLQSGATSSLSLLGLSASPGKCAWMPGEC